MTDPRLLHSQDSLAVGDLVLRVAAPTRGSALEIVVERDASLVLKGPPTATAASAREFVTSKRSWIYRRLAEKDALVGPPTVKSFVPGEGFAYLGRSYRLVLDERAPDVRLDRGRFVMSARGAREGRDAMRRWYFATGQPWLQRRLQSWSPRAGVAGVEVEVRDLGYRWGSVRPTDGSARINVHWATLQLPPSVIDYVLVHELAHLSETNHTPEYWTIVGRLMPGYEARKALLASIGKNVWLGQTADEPKLSPSAAP